ncbi:hypothetical protein SBA6_600003 [Candidatus Sulfopaludibacter sp. SbA6]|nr:hypothetical protein SBA6_600003 [Candidatus Sulfopaludibacter sp. SbA6]
MIRNSATQQGLAGKASGPSASALGYHLVPLRGWAEEEATPSKAKRKSVGRRFRLRPGSVGR